MRIVSNPAVHELGNYPLQVQMVTARPFILVSRKFEFHIKIRLDLREPGCKAVRRMGMA
jgi:hypothetical protein